MVSSDVLFHHRRCHCGANLTLRPDVLRDLKLDHPSVSRCFDPFAFAASAPDRFATQGRGIRVGPGTNLLNKPNYENPILNITDALNPNLKPANVSSRHITAVIDRYLKFDSSIPRQLQVLFRVEF